MNTEISVKTRWLVVLAAVVLVTGVSCGGEGNHPGGDPPPSLPTLSIASVNMANAVDFGGGANWQTRVDRLVTTIEGAQLVPDFISLTEIAGLWNCSTPPYRRAGDYDMIDRLLWRLDKRLSANYRVAYMVGVTGSVNNDFGTPLCWFHSGDALLYNPDRLVNLTPADVAGKAQERHDGPLLGTYIRRSLPICSRDTTLMPLEQLIDGPDQTDRCNTPTPSGPAWVQVDSTRGGGQTLVASLGRFSLRAAPGSSFDVVTSHLQSPEEVDHTGPVNDFIAALTSPPFRTSAPYYPVLVVGDFNDFAAPEQNWPAGTTQVLRHSVMAINQGAGVGVQPQHQLTAAFSTILPQQEPCALPDAPATGFSDHCGLLVRFDGS